jgi:hypothetical protein
MSISFSMRVVTAPDVMFRAVGDESVLLNLATELYLGLDPVGTRIWTVLVAAPSIQTAFETLLAEYDTQPEQLRQDLQEFLAKLQENGLIEIRAAETAASPAQNAAGAASE